MSKVQPATATTNLNDNKSQPNKNNAALTDDEDETMRPKLNKSNSLPKLTREKYRQNKIYRAPPTPTFQVYDGMEKSFVLDCVAVGNISEDYSRANPKLGSVIPPYDSIDDPAASNYLNFYGVKKFLTESKQLPEHQSIAGRVHDRFYTSGFGFKYLDSRNKFGNGRHPETVDGHSRFMGEQTRVMISYNNMYGYRRNVPKLRTEPPSTFSVDPRWLNRIRKTYGEHYDDEELIDHFKHTYMIGYPFYDNNYNNFHPTVKYVITVKTGEQSPDEFNGNLGINIIARNFDTGFINLDENIARKKEQQQLANKKQNKPKFFKRNTVDTFEFEDLDIRTVSAIILSQDTQSDKALYLDYVDLEIHRANERVFYRFPFEGWVRMGKQDRKTEELKRRFGKKNSIISYPNEKPKFEYTITVAPPTTKDTEYEIKINYEVKKLDAIVDYTIEFANELPAKSDAKVTLRLNGMLGESELFTFGKQTASLEKGKSIYKVSNVNLGELKHATILYDDNEKPEFVLKQFNITDSDGLSYVFEIEHPLKANKERLVRGKLLPNKNKGENNKSKNQIEGGKLFMKLEGHSEATSLFELKDQPSKSENESSSSSSWHNHKRMEAFIGNILHARLRFEGKSDLYCRIKGIKVKSNKGQEFNYEKAITLRNFEETVLNDRTKNKKPLQSESRKPGQFFIQIIGEHRKTDLFELKDAVSDENNLDQFYRTDNYLGKIKNVLLKYENKSNHSFHVNYIEITDPRMNVFKYVVELDMKNGDSVMLPRKTSKNSNEKEPEPKKAPTPEPIKKEEPKKPSSPIPKPENPNCDYEITVKKDIGVSNVPISLKIFGTKGETNVLNLVPPETKSLLNVDINRSDKYTKNEKNVGEIQKVKLIYEAKGVIDKWGLDSLEIKTPTQNFVFPVSRVFTKSEELELMPGVKPDGGIDVKGNLNDLSNKSGIKF